MAAALRRVSGLLRPLIPLSQRGQGCATQLASRFSTLTLGHTQRPAICSAVQLSSAFHTHLTWTHSILKNVTPLLPSTVQPARTLTYISLRKGKRKSVKSVVKRFLRLHCGLWIRKKAGYKKKLWKKKPARKQRLRQHVFCNRTQSKLLDKMTTPFWRRRNWFANDPYQKYHDRTNLQV
ncbi:large ribosomal subunit protein bL35m-like isoform X1 [Acipenser ruthenus]|uniref:large ribosomal subunit protein bL35m-like isoform X1 n=1 Tax=Acipenser ruthenus TaxID=7906 RepID=UPI00145B8F01|nr:large ribosomal subunit protein bL35m-like isoform X1 [Acipenser ruthenus]